MASLVRDGALSPFELIESHLQQIEAENPRVNAFVRIFADEARAGAREAEAKLCRREPLGLLHGIPVTIKDSIDVAGWPTLAGSRLRSGHRAEVDAACVSRLRAAGAILLGKTNTAELLLHYETDNYVTGRTNNPWNVERTAGGSSGGEGAAIASFCSAGGIGSDGGGSIRVPAHFCGIAGLKPTPGRISGVGHWPEICHPGGLLGVVGPMARTVKDVRLLFSALAGYDDQDPFSAPAPLRSAATGCVTLGVMEAFGEVPVDPEIRSAVRRAADLLAATGLPVEPFQACGMERAPNLWWFFFGQLPAPAIRRMIAEREDDVHWTGTEFLKQALREPSPTGEQVFTNLAERDRLRSSMLRQMQRRPVLLTPVCGVTAFPHRARRFRVEEREIGLFQAMMPATVWNLLGFPAVAVPFAISSEGLPIGVQLVGRPWEEELILEIAERLEEERGPLTRKE